MNTTAKNHPEEMATFFNNVADGYDDHMKESITAFDELYTTFTDQILKTNEEIKILDLGCGTGLEFSGIFKNAPNAQITGIELSKKMLNQLKEKYKTHLNQIILINDSYLSLKYNKNTYDYIISMMSIHHLLYEKKLKLYKEIRKLLKPGCHYIEGDYIVSEEEEAEFLNEYNDFNNNQTNYKDGDYHLDVPFSLDNQKKILYDAGFSKVEVIWHKEKAAIFKAYK